MKYALFFCVLVSAAVILAACGASISQSDTGSKPSIGSFTASPTTISAGSTTTLSWQVTGASSLVVDHGVGAVTGQDTIDVTPSLTTTYTLTAANPAGSVTASTTVTVGHDGGGGDPLLITTTLDGSRSVTQLVMPEGATLTTEAADGTRYTLTIPQDGLTLASEITMTPIVSVAGFPLSDGFLGGVHFEPEGLYFATPALLTIQPARQVAIDNHITFAARGNGEAYLYPIEPDTSTISMQVRHFSDYGAGSGTDSDRSAAAEGTPSQAADRITQNMAQASDRYRRGIITFEEWRELLAQGFQQYYQHVVKPKMDHAETIAPNGNPADFSTLAAAIAEYASWEKQLQLLGYDDFMQSERGALKAQSIRIIQKFYAAVYDRCINDHDLSVIQLLISLERHMQLLGIEYKGEYSDCLQFELEFDSDMFNDQDFWGHTVEQFRVLANVPISFQGTTLTGVAPLDYISHTASGWFPLIGEDQCTISPAGTKGSTFAVLSLEIVHAAVGQTPTIALVVDPGTPTEYTTVTCDSADGGFSYESESTEWLRFWQVNRSWDTESPEWLDEAARTITDWEYKAGEIIAAKTFMGDGTLPRGYLTAVETTVLTLRHAPNTAQQ